MARAKKSDNRRGSPEAVAKRRAARALNQLFDGLRAGRLDGRTEKRRQRLMKELKTGRRGTPLAPTEIVSHASELLRLGETLSTIRKNGVLKPSFEPTPGAIAVAREVQKLNGYEPKAWKLLGVDLDDAEKKAPGGRGTKKAPRKKAAKRASAK
jgi:hypothetical protein